MEAGGGTAEHGLPRQQPRRERRRGNDAQSSVGFTSAWRAGDEFGVAADFNQVGGARDMNVELASQSVKP
ncbi:hypothetical protein E2C01_061252 [Portunus trituberculatus]|uniref:Uncharacterized protein n=1 Tax=Portunus trituberculatus TaxID=210409 RepID=A0A5B7HCN4_PORTR|nr:hypothetical protein [Portunus trituberculatus]